MNIERQDENDLPRRVRVRVCREDDFERKRITPVTVLTILLVSAVVGVIVGTGAGRLIQLFRRERIRQEQIVEVLRAAAVASQTDSTNEIVVSPSPEPAE